MADIDGVDLRRAMVQQHIGEAAGRGADIDATRPPGERPKCSIACASLTPPRETQGWSWPRTSSGVPGASDWPGFSIRRSPE